MTAKACSPRCSNGTLPCPSSRTCLPLRSATLRQLRVRRPRDLHRRVRHRRRRHRGTGGAVRRSPRQAERHRNAVLSRSDPAPDPRAVGGWLNEQIRVGPCADLPLTLLIPLLIAPMSVHLLARPRLTAAGQAGTRTTHVIDAMTSAFCTPRLPPSSHRHEHIMKSVVITGRPPESAGRAHLPWTAMDSESSQVSERRPTATPYARPRRRR